MKTGLRLLGVSCLLFSGCFTVPARSSGPSESDGVQMAIIGQYCEESNDPEWVGNELVQIRMKIEVTNRGSVGVQFHPDRVHLIAPDLVSPTPVAADSSLLVDPGDSKVASVRFLNRGSLKCREEMRLDASNGLTLGNRTVSLRPIAFVARDGT